jgi:hypothetical protein
MKKTYKLLLLPLAFLLTAFSLKTSFVNDNIVYRIAQQLHKFYSLYPQEKVYLHQDKTLYSLGETIWFKAYLTKTNVDTVSTVIYADLISPDNKVLFSRTLQAKTGMAPGDFYLPDTLAEGLYQIRAYTNWMRNFDQAYFFTKEIKIASPNLQDVKASITSETRSYPNGDSIMVTIQLYKHPFEPVKHCKLKLQVTADGKTVRKGNLETDSEGIARISLHFDKAQQTSLGETMLLVQSDEKKLDFKKMYRVPVGRTNLDLQFFPEGGQMVAGIASKVAFKAVDVTGKGESVTGTIYDQDGTKVTDFKSEHLGMGVLTLTPVQGRIYTAKIKQQDGSITAFTLPSAKAEGVVLSINRVSEQTVNFKITNNYSHAVPEGNMYLVAHAEKTMVFAVRVATDKKQLESAIPASRFPAGLIHFTLFDQAGNPLCERLAYVNHPPQLKLSISTDKPSYGKRQKVSMVIEAKDDEGNPVEGNFSLAVRDAYSEVEPSLNPENMYTSLSLSSELKGQIEQPAYYFDKSQAQASRHLDLLLMTQGWRRFDWNDILQDKFPSTPHNIEQSIVISGHVEKEYGKKTPQKSNLTLIIWPEKSSPDNPSKSDNGGRTLLIETNEDGSFHFSGLEHENSLDVFIQARSMKGMSNRIIKRDVPTSPDPSFHAFEHASITPEKQTTYRKNMDLWAKTERQYLLSTGAILLKQVDVTAKKTDSYNHQRIHLKEMVDATVDLKKEKAVYGYVLDYLRGRVPGVRVAIDSSGNTTVSIRGGKTPLFLMDGMRVDISFMRSIPMSEVEFIEVIKGPSAAVYGSSAANGVIAFYTRRANPDYDWSKEKAPGVISFKLPGYNKPKEFYAPRYDVPDERHNLPDYRNTLHWQHTVTTDASGKAHITFFTSDVITEFIATCEGMSKGGIVGTAEHRFNRLSQ